MEEGKSLNKDVVEAALKAAKLELVSITKETLARPKSAYLVEATGAT